MTTEPDASAIQDAVCTRYTAIAQTAVGKFAYPTGRAGAVGLDYDPSIMVNTPDAVLESFCGVGNPFSLGPIKPGEAVLDVGCGAGFDLLVASCYVGATGQAYGVDLTPAMGRRAQRNLRHSRAENAQVVLAGAEALPLADASVDVVISNGVLNLSPLKAQSFQEIFRVLQPNGRLQFADIVLQEALPLEVTHNLDAWSG